jgi:hypothetical protein
MAQPMAQPGVNRERLAELLRRSAKSSSNRIT